MQKGGNRMNRKIVSVVIAAIVAIVGVNVLIGTSETDGNSTNGLGEFNFFVAGSGATSWTTYEGAGYNAYIALDAALGSVTKVADGNYTITQSGYQTINPDYGTFTKIGEDTTTTTMDWYVQIYSPSQQTWIQGPVKALGFYQAYSDYDSNMRTANIALYYTSIENPQLPAALPTGTSLRPITDVLSNNAFKVTFHISVQTGMTKPAGIEDAEWSYLQTHTGTYYGYGSNGYSALVNAISSTFGNPMMLNILNGAINNGSYGYVSSILGVKEVSTSVPQTGNVGGQEVAGTLTTYDYWSVYIGSGTGTYSLFLLGFMTPVSGLGSDFVFNEFTLEYTESTWWTQNQE